MSDSESSPPTSGSFRRLRTYLFRDVVAESDVGTVYRGYDQAGGGPVQIKVGRAGLAELRIAPELFREIAHPQIVRIRDAFATEQGEVVLVQDVPAGRTVEEAHAGLDGQYRQIAHLIREAAMVLAAAHGSGVTHGDISPRTVLTGADDLPHFSEFGMGLRTGVLGGEDPLGRRNGDASESARERKFKLDERADLFALGAVLYFLLTGQRVSEEPLALLSDPNAPRDDIPSIDVTAPEAPPDLRAICAQALATDPIHRYLHASQLIADLDAYLFGKRGRRWVKMTMALVGAALAGLFGVWGATGGGPARIVGAELHVKRAAAPQAGYGPLAEAEHALLAADEFRLTAQLSKPARVSVLYRTPSGELTLLGSAGDVRSGEIVVELPHPSGAAGVVGWRAPPPAGPGVLLIITHADELDMKLIDGVLLSLGEPPRSFAAVAWYGRHLATSTEPPLASSAGSRHRSFRAYAEQIAKDLDGRVDDVAVALVYVVGV